MVNYGKSLLVMPGRTLVEAVKDMIELHEFAAKKIAEHEARGRELKKRIAELTAPVTVDGKTPGRVAYMAYKTRMHRLIGVGNETRDDFDDLIDDDQCAWADCALAVLRAFGQPSQTTQDAADALRRARARIEAAPVAAGACRIKEGALAIIDDEIAKLGAAPARNAATPKFFVAENELRGSYFCTAITLRPYLHIGHDIEFNDIPRRLKLRRNDIIEVRVVERAKP